MSDSEIKNADKSMFIDGTLYVSIGVFTFLQTHFGSDEAAKFIVPLVLFWIKTFVGSTMGGCLAMKMFRSTAFADNRAAKASNGGTSFIVRQQTPVVDIVRATEPPKDQPTP